MKRVRVLAFVLALLAGAFDAAAVESLDELLEQTRNTRAIKAKENAAREQEFLSSPEKQASLLATALRERDAAEARSKQLSASFDAISGRILCRISRRRS